MAKSARRHCVPARRGSCAVRGVCRRVGDPLPGRGPH